MTEARRLKTDKEKRQVLEALRTGDWSALAEPIARHAVVVSEDFDVMAVLVCDSEATAADLAQRIEARGPTVTTEVMSLSSDDVTLNEVPDVVEWLFTDPE